MTFHPNDLPDLSGKVYIVTGGNAGIGYYTVLNLAKHGAKVYMGARSEDKAKKAIDDIKSLHSNANISILLMDHKDLSTVRSAAQQILSRETALHGLINNAGIMATPFEMTRDGHEAQWQTNYIAHWIFTSYLLPLLLSTSKGVLAGTVRVVNITSSGHFQAPSGGINWADTSLPNNPRNRYGQSKLANILHAKTLNKLYGPGSASAKVGEGEIWTASVHPGLVTTQLAGRAEGQGLKTLLAVFNAFGGYTDADTGSWTSVFCVASPEFKKEQSGTYFERIAKKGLQSGKAKNMELAAKLEDWTKKEMLKEGWVA